MTIIGEAFIAISPDGAGFQKKLESQLKGLGISNAGTAVGLGIAGGVAVGLAAIGLQFDKANKQIQQETGATGAQLKGLAGDVTTAFRNVPTSLGNAATAVDELYRRGVPLGPQLENLAQQELFLAKITKTDLGTAVEATTGLMQKFNVPVQDQSRELDVLFKAYQASGQGLSVLTGGLQSGGAVLQQFGFNLDQSASLLALLEKSSVNLQPALAGLRLAFGKITTEGGDPKKVLADLIEEFKSGKNPTQALSDAINLFGKRSGTELAVSLQKGKFNADALFKSITDGKGGIIATGLATETLGDQFKVLRNNIEANLAGLGTTVLHDVEGALADFAPPVEHLIGSIGNLLVVLAPAAQGLLIFLAPLKLAAPIIDDFATGLDLIVSGLSHVPGPILAVTAVIGLGVLAYSAYTDAAVSAVAASIAFDAVVEFSTGPIGLAIGAVTLLGAAYEVFTQNSRDVAKEAKAIGDSLFTASGSGGVFKTGISNATQGLQQFLATQESTGKLSKNVTEALSAAGSNVTDLAKAVTGGEAAWNKYRDAVVKAGADASPIKLVDGGQQFSTFAIGLTRSLNDQRDAFEKSSQKKLADLILTDQLSGAQERNIIATNTNKKGVIDYAGALNDANAALAVHVQKQNAVIAAATSTKDAEAKLATQLAAGSITSDDAKTKLEALGLQGPAVTDALAQITAKATGLQQAQDLLAQKTAPLTAGYAALAQQIALGTITEQDAETELHKMGFSITGAKTAFSSLSSEISTFVSNAVSQLPNAASVISDLASKTTTDKSKLQSDLAERSSLQKQAQDQAASSGASAARSLANSLNSINSKITLDQQRIADGAAKTNTALQSDLARRTVILQNAARSGGAASASLKDSIEKNDAAIAADQKKLAQDTDIATFTKNLITSAVQIATFQANLQKLVSEGFGNLAGVLADQGPKAAGALAAGFESNESKAKIANAAVVLGQQTTNRYSDFLKQNFPELSLASQQVGNQVGKGIGTGLTKELLKLFPQLRPLLVGIGESIASTVGNVLSEHDEDFARFGVDGATLITDNVRETLAAHRENIKGLFVDLGHDADTGVAKGITDKTIDVTKAINAMANGAIAAARKSFRSHSPSLEGVDIGADFAAGLAIGITNGTNSVVHAASDLAGRVVAATGVIFDTGAGGVPSQIANIGHRLEQTGQQTFEGKPFQPPPPPAVTQHPTLVASGLPLQGGVGTERLDALDQQRAAQSSAPPSTAGLFDGAQFVFGEKQDPLHIANDIWWAVRHGLA